MDNAAGHQAGRGGGEVVHSSRHCGRLEEVHCSLKAHLLQRRAVGFHAYSVEGLVDPLKGHVVSDEGEVARVNCNVVDLEHT